MDIKSYCPCCGVYTIVRLTQEEASSYKVRGNLPVDFSERAICMCCTDDGFKYKPETWLLHESISHA